MRCIFRSQRYIQSGGHSGVMVVFTREKVRVTLWGLYLNVYIYVYRRGLGPSLEHFPAPSYGAMVPGSVRCVAWAGHRAATTSTDPLSGAARRLCTGHM